MSAGPPVYPRLKQHPDHNKLVLNGNYFWDRMMASVARPSTVAGESAMLRHTVEQTDAEVQQLRSEMGELKRRMKITSEKSHAE